MASGGTFQQVHWISIAGETVGLFTMDPDGEIRTFYTPEFMAEEHLASEDHITTIILDQEESMAVQAYGMDRHNRGLQSYIDWIGQEHSEGSWE